MFDKMRLLLGAAVVLGLAASSQVLAASPHPGPVGPIHQPMPGHTMGPIHQMPPHNFHAAPPSFHGTLPHRAPTATHRPLAGPGHDIGVFHGHDFRHFTPVEHTHWQHGEWRHAWHRGHLGWWWFVDGFWFYYPAPVYPYPLYVGSADYYDYYDEYGAPDYYWYWCADPEGYYPYVTECSVPWQAVPPTPSDQ